MADRPQTATGDRGGTVLDEKNPTMTETRAPDPKEPAAKEPVTKEPVTKEPVTKEPVTKEPVTKEPETKEPDAKEEDRLEANESEAAGLEEGGARPAPADRPAADEPESSADAAAPAPPGPDQAPPPQAPDHGAEEPPVDRDPGDLDEAALDEAALDDSRADGSASEESPSAVGGAVSDADITDAIVPEEADLEVDPVRPDAAHDDPGFESGAATEHQQDLLPSDEGDQDDSSDDESPGGGPGGGPTVDLGAVDPEADFGSGGAGGDGDEDAVFDLDPSLDGPVDTGKLTEHEQNLFDELADDPLANPLDDPVVTGEEVPDEYDLSGNETSADPKEEADKPLLQAAIDWLTQPASGGEREVQPSASNPVPGHKYVEGEGWVPLEEGEEDPDRTTLGESRAEAMAEAAEQEEEEPVDYGDVGIIDWVVSWFEDDEVDDGAGTTEDRGQDSAPAPKNPSIDPEHGDTHFGIGVEAERNAEIQYADMPEDGDSGTAEYDGIDYGDSHTEPSFDSHEADQLIYVDVFDQPDVDPTEHDDTSDDSSFDEALLE